MGAEKDFARFISNTEYDSLPLETIKVVKNVLLNIMGTIVAGSTREGCQALVDQVGEWGGKEEATILILSLIHI